MKIICSQCIAGTLISGKICGRCKGTGEIEKVKKARLDIDLGKHITFEEDRGFVLTDMNDSIYFTDEEAIKIANFLAEHHQTQSIILVKSKFEL